MPAVSLPALTCLNTNSLMELEFDAGWLDGAEMPQRIKVSNKISCKESVMFCSILAHTPHTNNELFDKILP